MNGSHSDHINIDIQIEYLDTDHMCMLLQGVNGVLLVLFITCWSELGYTVVFIKMFSMCDWWNFPSMLIVFHLKQQKTRIQKNAFFILSTNTFGKLANLKCILDNVQMNSTEK